MTKQLNSLQEKRIIQAIPAKRLGKPKDIASAVIFLSSDNANYITGQTLHINGGLYMN